MKTLALLSVAFLFALTSGCGGPGSVDVTLQSVGNEMKFDKTAFSVKAGQTVNITLQNNATSEAMVHNFVLLGTTSGDEVNRIGIAAVTGGAATEYVPDDPMVLAASGLAKPGETITVTFTAPTTPGTYTYICTYPGHYALMQGVMTVEA